MADGEEPLLVFFDSEAANGSVYYGDIIEIGAKCHPEAQEGSFQTLISTKQDLCSFVVQECGITREDLSGKPFFPKALRTFLNWIDGVVASASHKNGLKYFPVLCAHGGYSFDFLILLGNMERFGLCHSLLTQHNLYFADSFQFCKEIKEQGEPLLQDARLSLDCLFLEFFPREAYKDRHRAMGDVDAMMKIFTETPLKNQMHKMTYTTAKERVTYYINQASLKLQQQILEDNISRLDACSKNMAVKRLIREGLTYDRLQRIFEECCSFMDFFQFLKDKGVERKVAKFIALQFGGMGLQNQGALLKPATEKPNSVITDHLGSSVIAKNGCSSTSKTPLNASKKSVTLKEPVDDVLPVRFENAPADPTSGAGRNSEDWDDEIADVGGEIPEFTLTFGKAIPISLMIEDLCSPALRTEQAKSSRSNRKKTPVVDCQSNSEQISIFSSEMHRKRKVLEKERNSEVRSSGEFEESDGLSSAESKPEPSVNLNETSMIEATIPTKGSDVNGTLDEDAQCIPKDDKVLNRETEEEIPQQCVWFTDEAIFDVVASMEAREFVTVFIGDVAIHVPVNQTLSKTPCHLISQPQSPSCLDHEQDEKDHDFSTQGERSVELNDFNTESNLTSSLNQGEFPVQTSIMALETDAADEASPGESLPKICDTLENGLDARVTESEQARNGVSELRLNETATAFTETGNIFTQFAYPEALDETKSTRTSPASHSAVRHGHFLSDKETEDSNSISEETPDEALSKNGLSNFSKEQQRCEIQAFSFLETDADKDVGERLVSLDSPGHDCHLRHENRINGGQHVDQGDPAVVPPHVREESYQGIAGGNEKNALTELRRARDAGHCGRILHQLYSSHGNPYRGTSHYPYPSTSHPPFSFVPRMLPMQPMFMQQCFYPTAYSSANFGGGQTRFPFFAPPTVQRAMFQASSGLHPHSDGIQATPAEQKRATHEDCADAEFEPNENSPADCDGNGPCAVERYSTVHYDNRSETSYEAPQSGLSYSGLTETWPAPVAPQSTRNGLSDDFDASSCSSVSTDREEETPIKNVHGHDQLGASVNEFSASELGASVNDISTSLANGSVKSGNENTQDACSSSSGFPDTTTSHVGGVGGSPKPQRIRRPRNRKTLNGNKSQNGIDGHIAVSQSLKAYVARASQHNKGSFRKDQDRANSKVYIAPKQCAVSSSRANHEELKSFKGNCSQSKTTMNALETARTSCEGRKILTKRNVKVDKGSTTSVSSEMPRKEIPFAQKQPLSGKDFTTFQEHSKKSRIYKGHKRRARQDASEKSKS